ncbi:MAG: hypothetical protein ACYC8T_37205 [Myxococcaceae bacterium]
MKASLLALMLVPVVSFAAGPGGPPGPGPGGDPALRQEHKEKRQRTMLVVGLAVALDLNETEALRMAEKVRAFEDKRRPLRTEMTDSMKVLREAARGDQAALAKVDQATTRVLDHRAKLAAIDKDMFNALAKDLTPQRRAQLAIFLAQFQRKAGGMGGPGRGAGMGMGMGRGGQGPGPGGPGMGGPGGGWGGRSFDPIDEDLDE